MSELEDLTLFHDIWILANDSDDTIGFHRAYLIDKWRIAADWKNDVLKIDLPLKLLLYIKTWAYTNVLQISNNPRQSFELLEASKIINSLHLENAVLLDLKSNIAVGNVVEILNYAHDRKMKSLTRAALCHLLAHFETVYQNHTEKLVLKLSLPILIHLLSSSHLVCNSEDHIFDLVAMVEHHRREFITDHDLLQLFKCVRYSQLRFQVSQHLVGFSMQLQKFVSNICGQDR